jgi:RNA polymerase sigma factor (sigma-70 family)
MPMQDREVVAAIVAGDQEGIAEAYDRYAMPLYSYCRSLLREPEDAADAVQDTFLIATAKLGGLREPGKLRSWLYAVARNECYRRLRSGQATSALDEAVDVPAAAGFQAGRAGSADVASAVEQAELRQLVRDAIGGLNPGERDVIELGLVQGLDGDELADALGVSRNHAHSLQSRARSQLERSLGALVVARAGRDACPALDTMLAGWDGQLTVLMRKRISRHIDQCEICSERKRRELTPALFAGALPLVALMPGFREHVLKMCADHSLEGVARRADVAARAGQFGAAGFPVPIIPPGVSRWHQLMRHSHALVASAATAAAAAGVSAVLIIGGGAPQSHAPAAGARGSAGPGVVPNSRGAPSRGGTGTSPGGGASGSVPGSVGATAPGVLGTAPGSHPAPGKSGSGSSGAAGHSATSAPGSSSGPGSQSSPASSSGPGSQSSASAPPAPGTLTVSTGRLVLVAVNGHGVGTFTLTAKGGPVSYSISAAADLSISPASGSLAAGASATITVTSSSLISLDEQLTVNPGGYTVTVVLSISL